MKNYYILRKVILSTHNQPTGKKSIHLPHRKPKGGELSSAQKEENHLLSSRMVLENAFAGVKRYGAVSQVYRNRQVDFDDYLMSTRAG